LDEIGRKAGIRTGVTVLALGGAGRSLHEIQRALRSRIGLARPCVGEGYEGVVGNLLQRPAIEVARDPPHDVVCYRHSNLPGPAQAVNRARRASRAPTQTAPRRIPRGATDSDGSTRGSEARRVGE